MMDADVLGVALFNAREAFNNKTRDELISEHGDLAGVRLAACKADAEAIINHIKEAGVVLPGLTLTAGPYPVTGTGTIE